MEGAFELLDDYAIRTGQPYVYASGGFCARGVTPEAAFMKFTARMDSFSAYMQESRKKLKGEPK
jgi:hypothetical protein